MVRTNEPVGSLAADSGLGSKLFPNNVRCRLSGCGRRDHHADTAKLGICHACRASSSDRALCIDAPDYRLYCVRDQPISRRGPCGGYFPDDLYRRQRCCGTGKCGIRRSGLDPGISVRLYAADHGNIPARVPRKSPVSSRCFWIHHRVGYRHRYQPVEIHPGRSSQRRDLAANTRVIGKCHPRSKPGYDSGRRWRHRISLLVSPISEASVDPPRCPGKLGRSRDEGRAYHGSRRIDWRCRSVRP